jgi:hypothetical protein
VTAKHTRLIRSRDTVYDRVLSLAHRVRSDISSGSSVEITGSRAVLLGPLDTLRSLMRLSVSGKRDNAAKAILLRACYHAEQRSALGAACLIETLCSNDSPGSCKALGSEEYQGVLSLLGVDRLSSLVYETITQAGPLATINVSETDRVTHSIVLDSIDVPVSPIGEFGDNLTLVDCRFLVHDGIVERVSEINSIIEKCSSEKSSMVIYARGFGYEVVATLLHNWRIGKLRVLPVSARADDIQNFWFVDLPNLFTRMTVDNSLRNYDNLIPLDRVTLSSGIISVSDSRASSEASTLKTRIMKESREMGVERTWSEERSRRLSSRKVEIAIGKDYADSRGVVKDRVGTVIRCLTASRSRGIVERSLFGRQVWVPAIADLAGRDSAESLRLELKTSTLVVQDE